VLWAVARSRINLTKQRRWRRLLEKRQQGGLTEPEQQELACLMADSDRLTVCKAQAYLLLKERGHRIPVLERVPRRDPGWYVHHREDSCRSSHHRGVEEE
jgi:hypothetical protein